MEEQGSAFELLSADILFDLGIVHVSPADQRKSVETECDCEKESLIGDAISVKICSEVGELNLSSYKRSCDSS
jgi:hypothetical protein